MVALRMATMVERILAKRLMQPDKINKVTTRAKNVITSRLC